MGELLLRMVFSLAVVVGLLILISRVAARRLHGRAGSPIEVLHRQALSKSASVSVVSVAGRVLVLGSTDQQVNVLTELAPDALGTSESHDVQAEDPAEDLAGDLAEDLADAQDPALGLDGLLEASYGTEALPSLEALLAEPDQVTLEELFGHRPPAHAAPAATPADAAAAYAAPVEQVAPPAPVAVQDEEDPYLPEDPSYAAFASALRAQLATGAHGEPAAPTAHPGGRTGRHAAPAPAMELPPAVTGGARAARPAEPAPAVPAPVQAPPQASAQAPAAAPSAATAPAGPSAADLAALRAALLSAQLQAGTTAAVRTTAPTTPTASRPAPEAGLQPEGALSGSVLSPTTWRQAYRAVTRRAS